MNFATLYAKYYFQATGGKKLKKGPFNGLLTIKLPINTDSQLKSHGLCSGKCLKISSNRLKSISGHFDNDVLQVSDFYVILSLFSIVLLIPL